MGSLFYINVPTREHEFLLRQQLLQMKLEKEVTNVNKELLLAQLKLKPDIRVTSQRKENVGPEIVTSQNAVTSEDPAAGTTTAIAAKSIANMRAAAGYNRSDKNILKTGNSVVDVFEATVNGKKTNIVVSQDAMIVYPHPIPTKDDKEKKQAPNIAINEVENIFLEKHLEEALKTFKIYDATWGQSVDGSFSQVSFTVQDSRAETIINYMLNLGIGTKYDSTLGVCSAVVYYNPNKKGAEKMADGEVTSPDNQKESFTAQFIASIKSRLTVAQIVQSVQSNAVITFDYLLLLTIAAIIAALGLLESSSVNLVASMLISPLMGPIMAGCFGTVIRDMKLIKTGVISELIGLALCVLIGFIVGVCVSTAPFPGPWHNVKHWPTDEMLARGRALNIAVGALVAIPSGAGVALSILAGNAGSLVGVAISASLLPPAVNCGIYFGMCAIIAIQLQIKGYNPYTTPCGSYVGNEELDSEYRKTHDGYNETENFYCKNVVMDYGIQGGISFALTMVNIVLILLSGFCILKLKEVAPYTTRKQMDRFWKEDLKVMREYNKTHGSFNKKAILAEIGGQNNAASIRARLASDTTYNQVARRNVFGNQMDFLDPQSFSSSDGIFSSSDGIQTTASLNGEVKTGSSSGGGGGWWGWFGGKKKSEAAITPKPSHVAKHP